MSETSRSAQRARSATGPHADPSERGNGLPGHGILGVARAAVQRRPVSGRLVPVTAPAATGEHNPPAGIRVKDHGHLTDHGHVTVVRAVTVIMGTVVGLTFLF